MPSKDLELVAETAGERSERIEEDRLREQFSKLQISKGQTILHLEHDHPPITRALSQIVGSKGRVIVVIPSTTTVDNVKRSFGRLRNLSFLESNVASLALDQDSVDSCFSLGLLSVVPDPRKVLAEFLRVTKRGGRVIAGASDYAAFYHYPMPDYLESQMSELSDRLEEAKIWDPFLGRKLFSMLQELCLEDVRTHVFAEHIFVGEMNSLETKLWEDRLEKISQLQSQGLFHLSFDLNAFRSELFTFFQNPMRFSYSPAIFAEGRKPL